MKRNSLRIFCLAVISAVVALSCSVKEQLSLLPEDDKEGLIIDGVVEGELLVKFSPQVSAILDANGLTKASAGESSPSSGLSSVDEVLAAVSGYGFERVFPYDSRNEARTRENGLHLWYVVRFSSDCSVQDVARRLSALGEVSIVQCNQQIKRANVKKAVPFRAPSVKASSAPSDDDYMRYQWNLKNDGTQFGGKKIVAGADVNVTEAWKLSTGDPSIIVAVLDEGVCYDHPELAESMWVNEGEIWRSRTDNDGNGYAGDYYGYNFVKNTGVISSDDVYDSGHGTHVAGVIAARNNGRGINSIAGGNAEGPGVKIMSCQVFSGVNSVSNVLAEVRAIKYAADNGAVVLQCSWGYVSGTANPAEWSPQYATDEQWTTYMPLEKMALDYFIHNAGSPNGVIDGGIAVYAGGNEAAPSAGYPGAYKDYVSVAATAADFTPATYTNYGPGTTISAPGGDQDYYWDWIGDQKEVGLEGCVLSTLPFNVSETGLGYMEGTSMACPHVSGVIALGLSYALKLRKHFTADELKELLYKTATPIDSYMNGKKIYHKYVAESGTSAPVLQMDLSLYKNKMGAGQVNAAAFLEAIGGDGAGVPLSFPNVYVDVDKSVTYSPELYFADCSGLSVTVLDKSIAKVSIVDGLVRFDGVSPGQTKARVTCAGGTADIVITVRKGASQDGWM